MEVEVDASDETGRRIEIEVDEHAEVVEDRLVDGVEDEHEDGHVDGAEAGGDASGRGPEEFRGVGDADGVHADTVEAGVEDDTDGRQPAEPADVHRRVAQQEEVSSGYHVTEE